MRFSSLLVLSAAGLLVGSSGCNPQKQLFQLGLPGAAVEMTVLRATPRGEILDAELQAPGWELRTFAPTSSDCREVFTPGLAVQYRSQGAYGSFVRGERRCDATGLGSLAEWRDRRPRAPGRRPIASARATFEAVYSDAEVTLLRGRFPLLGRIGFLASGDDIVVVPNAPECERAVAQGQATLEYYEAGSHVLAFGAPGGRCEIVGVVKPPVREATGR